MADKGNRVTVRLSPQEMKMMKVLEKKLELSKSAVVRLILGIIYSRL